MGGRGLSTGECFAARGACDPERWIQEEEQMRTCG